MLDGRHVASWGSINFHRTVISPSRLWLTVATCGAFWSARSSSDARSRSTMRSPLDGGSYLTKNHDWYAIVAWSARDRGAFSAKSGATTSRNQCQGYSNSTGRQRLSLTTIVAHDRGSIVARLPHDQGQFTTKSGMIRRGIEATRLPSEIAPTTSQIRSHDRLNCPRFWAKILFKRPRISPLFFNFWSIREEIRRISRKISSSSWSPRVSTRLRSNWSGIDH